MTFVANYYHDKASSYTNVTPDDYVNLNGKSCTNLLTAVFSLLPLKGESWASQLMRVHLKHPVAYFNLCTTLRKQVSGAGTFGIYVQPLRTCFLRKEAPTAVGHRLKMSLLMTSGE